LYLRDPLRDSFASLSETTTRPNPIQVVEITKNLVGFDRALGCANHVTLGEAWLRAGATWGRVVVSDIEVPTLLLNLV
jgi:hypothetical protein